MQPTLITPMNQGSSATDLSSPAESAGGGGLSAFRGGGGLAVTGGGDF